MSQPCRLYQYAACPFCRKVRAALLYKGIPYETIEVHPLNKKQIAFSKEYKKVPIFIDDQGHQVNDSTLIMRHLDSRFAARPLFSNSPQIAQFESKWLKWADDKASSLTSSRYL